jgi:hypothetical protein
MPPELPEYLLEYCARVDVPDYKGRTPILHLLIRCYNRACGTIRAFAFVRQAERT